MRISSLKNGKVIEEDLTKLISERINLSDPVSWYICEFGNKLLELEHGLKLIRKSTEIMEARRFAEQALEK